MIKKIEQLFKHRYMIQESLRFHTLESKWKKTDDQFLEFVTRRKVVFIHEIYKLRRNLPETEIKKKLECGVEEFF